MCFSKRGGNQEGFPSQALFTPPFWALTLVTDAGQIWKGSLIFTASSFIPTVKKWFLKSAWSCGKRNTWWHQEGANTSENLFERHPHVFCHLGGPMFFPCQSKHRRREDKLSPRGHIYSTRPITSKEQGMSISAAASNQNLVHKETVLTKMRTWLRNGCLKISRGQSLSTSDTLWEQLRVHRCQDSNWSPARVMHNMDANSSAWPWCTLMDVQHLQGTKTSTWAGLQDGRWKAIFFSKYLEMD